MKGKKTMISKDLTTVVQTTKTDLVDPIVWKQMRGMAKTMIESKAMPEHIKNEAQAIVVMQMGYEMGMKPMQAINSLYIVKGQTTVWGKAIAGQFIKHGYRLSFKDEPNKTTVTAKHRSGFEATETFTFEEAEKSGYTKDKYGKIKFGWKEGANRNLKLRYNALNKLAKTQCPEVLGTAVGITEVYQDTIHDFQDGEIVDNEKMLDIDFIKQINNTRDQKELIDVCKTIKGEVSKEYYNSLESEYTRRKIELSEEVK